MIFHSVKKTQKTTTIPHRRRKISGSELECSGGSDMEGVIGNAMIQVQQGTHIQECLLAIKLWRED